MSAVVVITGAADELRADGLWAAALRALADGPATPEAVIQAITNSGSRYRRRRKTTAALCGLERNGWAAAGHAGWTITPAGQAALQALTRAPSAEALR